MQGPWSPLSQSTQAITGDHDLLLTSHHQVNRISAVGENSVQEDQLVPCPPRTFQVRDERRYTLYVHLH